MFTAVGEGDVSASQERLAAICRLYENAKTASDAALFEVMPYLAGVAEGGEAVKDLQHNFAKLEKLCQSPNDAIAALKEIRETLSEIRTLLTVIDA